MSDDDAEPEVEATDDAAVDDAAAEGEAAAGEAAVATAEPPESPEEDSQVPEFADVNERIVKRANARPELLHGVSIPVWAELGRVEMVIGDLLQLGEGSVVTLDRAVGDPVDLIAQGVKLARGEVIVVDDCFAIRIREVLSGENG